MPRTLSRLLAALSILAVVGLTSCAPEVTPGDPGTTTTVVSPTTVPPTLTNLIAYPSMESGTSTVVDGWLPAMYGNNTTVPSIVTGGAHEGNRSIKVTVTNYVDGDAKVFFTQLIPGVNPVPGATYTYTDWYKSSAASELNSVITMADGTVQYGLMASLAPATEWTKATGTYTVPAGAVKMTVYHLIETNGTLQVDDASLYITGSGSTTSTTSPPATTTTVKPTTTTSTIPTSTTTVPSGSQPFDRPTVSFEFDDGWQSSYVRGLPLFTARGIKPMMNVVTDYVKLGYADYMTPAQVKDWVAKGGEIGSHTTDHHSLVTGEPDGTTPTQAQIVKSMTDSKSYLTTLLGKAPTLFATPYCESNDLVVATAKTLYKGVRNCDGPINTKANWDPYNIKSISIKNSTPISEINSILTEAKNTNGSVVIVFHQVSATHSGDEYTSSVGEINAILDAVQASGIQVLSPMQAFAKASGTS